MSTRARREREKEARRQSILEAARELFFARGYANTTVPQIAEAAEIATGTVYLYFATKEHLYANLLLEGLDVLHDRMLASLDKNVPAPAQTRRLVEAYIVFAVEQAEYFDIIFFIRHQIDPTRQELRGLEQVGQEVREKESACWELAASVLREAQREGAFVDSTLNEEDAVEAIWAMLAGMVQYFRIDGRDVTEKMARLGSNLILNALFGQSRGREAAG